MIIEWGNITVYEVEELRNLVAESVSTRLGISFSHAKERLNRIHRIARYGQEKNDSGVER
jgi:hypothetical protein